MLVPRALSVEVAILCAGCRQAAEAKEKTRLFTFEATRDRICGELTYHEIWHEISPAATRQHKMRPLRIARNHLQLKSSARGFTSSITSHRQSAGDYKHPVQSPQPLTIQEDERGESAALKNIPSQEIQTDGLLSGKKVIITGASRGIGAAIAQRFAREGAKCVLVGRNIDALTRVREGLIGPYKTEHVVKVGDVGSLEFWKGVGRSEVSS